MTDATPSRPIPTRRIKDGIVEGEPTGNLDVAQPAPLNAAITTMRVCIDSKNQIYAERPVPQDVPRIGEFNSRGAQVENAFITSKAILRVDLK
jgi:hypothetical protein